MAQRGTTAKIDLRELEKLCALQATDEEVAAFFEVSTRTIERRRKNPKFLEVMKRGQAKGRLSLRRMQLRMAERGNPALLIWLGKQLLGQQDRYPDGVGQQSICIITPAFSIQNQQAIDAPHEHEPTVIDIGPDR
jgi:hypothetical protein